MQHGSPSGSTTFQSETAKAGPGVQEAEIAPSRLVLEWAATLGQKDGTVKEELDEEGTRAHI